MTVAAYKFEDTSRTPIEKLKAIIKADEARGMPSDFGWLKDILDETLEEYTIREFRTTAANIDAYNPLQVEMHLAEGSRLLDLCLNQRKEIYQLESQAILSALDICLSQQTLDFDHNLAKIHLAASVKQAQLPLDDGNTALQDRYETFRHSLGERLKLHNRPGNALNYGERVRFMRKLYVDNLRLAYQRLNAAWRGMAFAFRIKTVEPAYIPADDNVLDSLVKWMRDAITAVEETDAHERVFDVRIDLVTSGLANDLKERLTNLDFKGSYVGKFTLTKDYFNQFLGDHGDGKPTDTDAVRLLGLDLAFVYKNNDANWVRVGKILKEYIDLDPHPKWLGKAQQEQSFMAFVSDYVRRERELMGLRFGLAPPIAKTELAGKAYDWRPEMLRFEHMPAWTEGLARDHFKLITDPSFQNASPFGEWNYVFSGAGRGTNRFSMFGTNLGRSLDLVPGQAHEEFRVHDIVLFLRVAVRKSLHNKP